MTRNELLQKLSTTPFEFVDPLSEWKDVGFTERPIWVNGKGYGYIACDEPLHRCKVSGLNQEKWDFVLNKLSQCKLEQEDIEGTGLADLIDEMSCGCFYEEGNGLNECLKPLLDLPSVLPAYIFCLNSFDGWQFFATEQEYRTIAERDWCDYEWAELTDEILSEWVERLTKLQIL